MAFDASVLAAVRATFPKAGSAAVVPLGAPVYAGEGHPEPLIGIPLKTMNRHGLIAGATGTGKTKTLQVLTEGLSNASVPVLLMDIKGDLSGIGASGTVNDKITERLSHIGGEYKPEAFPVEF